MASSGRAVADVGNLSSAIARLKRHLSEVQQVSPKEMEGRVEKTLNLAILIDKTIADIFGRETIDYKRFAPASNIVGLQMRRPNYFSSSYSAEYDDPDDDRIQFEKELNRAKQSSITLLEGAIHKLEIELSEIKYKMEEDMENAKNIVLDKSDAASATLSTDKRIFIVHGRDDGTRETVARFIEKLGFKAIILHEQPNKGRSIINKFREEAEEIGFAVVLMTPDDHGGILGADTRPRARQNVVFELGFFIGALGPEKVSALVKGEVEKPSDFDGVVYISLDHGHWKIDLAKEFKAAGLEVDLNKAMIS